MSVMHVVPIDDLIEHEQEFDECACGPTCEFIEGGGTLVVHHALDGREKDEN